MQIDHALILAAGFGTRMGEIGKRLPKVLWPIFEQSLLEVQLRYARSLGCKRIFINLHHQHDIIYNLYLQHPLFRDVTWLKEDPILDIGGAIQNLASQKSVNYHGKLLVLNSDLLFWIPENDLLKALNHIEKYTAILFTQNVNSSDFYNALEIKNNILQSIIPNKDIARDHVIQTYSGISLINLSKLKKISGVTNFFKSVAIPKDQLTFTQLIEKVDYLDFGTASRYWNSNFELLTKTSQPKSSMLQDLINWEVIKLNKINNKLNSYSSNSASTINLSPFQISSTFENSIIIKMPKQTGSTNKNKIIYEDLIQEI